MHKCNPVAMPVAPKLINFEDNAGKPHHAEYRRLAVWL